MSQNCSKLKLRSSVRVGAVVLYGKTGDQNTDLALRALDHLGVQYGFSECNNPQGCLTPNGMVTETPTLTGLPKPSDRWEGPAVFEGLVRGFLMIPTNGR